MEFIKKISRTLKTDKKYHFIVGFIASFLCIYDLLLSLIFVQVLAIGKEIYDSFFPKKHTAEINDYFSTVAGGHLFITIFYSIIYLICFLK